MGLIYCWSSFRKSFTIPYPKWLKTLNYMISHDRHIRSRTLRLIWNKPQGTKYSELYSGKASFLFFCLSVGHGLLSSHLHCFFRTSKFHKTFVAASVRASAILQALTKSRYILTSIFSQESNNWLLFTIFPIQISVTSVNKYANLCQLCSSLSSMEEKCLVCCRGK